MLVEKLLLHFVTHVLLASWGVSTYLVLLGSTVAAFTCLREAATVLEALAGLEAATSAEDGYQLQSALATAADLDVPFVF